MSTPSASPCCAVCGWNLPAAGQACPECHASAEWQALVGAAQFTQARFDQWGKDRMIGSRELPAIARASAEYRQGLSLLAREGKPLPSGTGLMPLDRCWGCGAKFCAAPSHCPRCGVPVEGTLVEGLRNWRCACVAIKLHCDAGRLPLAQAHSCMNDAKGRIASLKAALEKQRLVPVAVVAEEAGDTPGSFADAVDDLLAAGPRPRASSAPPPRGTAASARGVPPSRPPRPRRPLWEMLLDPRSIQWLLGLGGALLVVGLVVWLAAVGVFENPVVVAVALGLGNAAILAGGCAVTRCTRYQTAGRALTLLACLVMPLNLWFYHANHLITLDGHLWVAAVVCCVLYAASAMVLRDPMFVYVLASGGAMTGLLMLADMGKFWEIAAPSTLLVTLGLICVHVERAFPDAEGEFSRRRFGLAFFWSGQALLAGGLLLLLGAQLAGDWLHEPFRQFYQQWGSFEPPVIVAERWGQLLALGLVLAGTYAYAYSDLVVRRVGVYIYLAVFTLLWAEVLVINLFVSSVTAELAIIALALTALAAHLSPTAAHRWQEALAPGEAADAVERSIRPLSRAALPLGLMLSTLPVLLGILLHLRATYKPLNLAWPLPGGQGPYTVTWLYVGAMLLTAVTCRLGAHLYRRSVPWLSTTYFFGTAAATLVGAAGLLSVLGIRAWDELAPILMILPILYIIAARLYRGHTAENPLTWTAQAATAVILAAVVAAAVNLTPEHVFEPATGARLNLLLALVFAEAAVFYALAAGFRKQPLNVYLCTAAACGAVWQLLQYWQVGPEYYTLTFALVGLGLLVGYRFAVWERTGLATPAFQCANALMSVSFVAAALLTLSRLAASRAALDWPLVFLLGGLAVVSLLAAWLVRHAAWRRWYLVMAITEAGLMFLTIHVLSHLTGWEKLEIFSVAIGVALLVVGHVGWHREQERQDDLVSFSLLVGSLLVGVPLAIAVLVHRSEPHFSALNELGMLTAGIVLLATGLVLQLRSTTLTGATLLLVYLLTLVLYVNMLENVQTAAIWMTIGGGVIFATGVLLSIYRDRLLTLPDQVKRREGIFRVLGWR